MLGQGTGAAFTEPARYVVGGCSQGARGPWEKLTRQAIGALVAQFDICQNQNFLKQDARNKKKNQSKPIEVFFLAFFFKKKKTIVLYQPRLAVSAFLLQCKGQNPTSL
jgi:hypothetical protein